MYRIELSPGEETAFRSIEELAVAIRRGVVTSKARIWHNATSKWLPIQFHPHYKTAATMPLTQADLVTGPPVAPLSSLSLPDPNAPSRVTPFTPVLWSHQPESPTQPSRVTPFRPASTQPEPPPATPRVAPFKPASPYHGAPPPAHAAAPTAGLPLIESLGSMSAPEPLRPEPARPLPAEPQPARPQPVKTRAAMKIASSREEPARQKKRSRTRRSSKRALRVAFVGALLIGGAQVLASANDALNPDGLRAHRRLIVVPPEAIKRDSPRTVAAVIPVLRNSSVPGGASKRPEPTLTPPTSTNPTLRSVSGAGPVPSVSDSVEIQAAPAVEMPAPVPAATDSLTTKVVDSTGKKVLKGILRAVSGAPGTEKKRSKR